ncbi:MAG: hypothetical protein U7123_25880 [Potamolinea sp.]
MTQLPEDDQEWLEFLRQNRPTPPPTTDNFEEQLMTAIATSDQQVKTRKMWLVPSAIAAGLLMAWSGHYFLNISQNSPNYASLETFLENNWNEVVGEVPANSQSNGSQGDWLSEGNTTQ